jgi:RNA polymerase sigma factor (sigma-70 family)
VTPLLEQLSPREEEVLVLLAAGLGLREVGRRLEISHWTARDHRDRARRKLQAATTTQAVAIVVAARARATA